MSAARKLEVDFPSSPDYRGLQGWAYLGVAKLFASQDRLQEAEEAYRQALASFERAVTTTPGSRGGLRKSQNRLVHLLTKAGRTREAEQVCRRTVALYEKLVAESPTEEGRYWRPTTGDLRQLSFLMDPHPPEIVEADGEASGSASGQTAVSRIPRYTENLAHYTENLALAHESLAAVFMDDGRSDEAVAEYSKAINAYTKAIELVPSNARFWWGRAKALAGLGRGNEALADFSKAIELNQRNAVLLYLKALAQLETGSIDGYRSTCAAMLERFGETEEPLTALWVAWTYSLGADAVGDLGPAVRLAEKAVVGQPETGLHCNTLGAVLYRAGRFEEAAQRLSELSAGWEQAAVMPTRSSPAYAWFFLAMAEHHLGRGAEARQWFEKAVQHAAEEIQGNPSWNRRVTLQLLRDEAAGVLGIDEEGDGTEVPMEGEQR